MRLKLALLLFLPLLDGFRVRTELNANWRETSILAEISEYLASQDESNFWKFVDEIDQTTHSIDTPKDQYEVGVSIAEKLLQASELGVFRLAMSLRTMSPRVEAHRRVALSTETHPGCFYDGSDININNLGDFNEQTVAFDHLYPVKSNASRTFVIYGSLGSKSTHRLISKAKSHVDSTDNLRFAFRHFDRSSNPRSLVSLSGYGVELAIKNTEYKAVDSSAQEEPESLHGLNFKVLHQKHQSLTKELESLRDHLEKMGEIVPLKTWELNDFGFKACQQMVESELEVMEQMIQDFPLHARTISREELDESFAETVKEYQKKMEKVGVAKGENLLAINGKVLLSEKGQNLDIYSLLDTLKQEQNAARLLSEIGLPPETDISRLLSSVDLSPVSTASYSFDYRDTLPVYLNDLESSFAPFKSLFLLFQSFPSGKIRPIARNIFNLIIFSDPFESNDELFAMIQEYVREGIYIRFGVVPVFDEKKNGMSMKEAVEKKKVSSRKKSLWPSKQSLLNALRRGNRFFNTIGRTDEPLVLLNGYPLDVNSSTFGRVLSSAVGRQTLRLQLALYKGEVTDGTNIADWWVDEKTNEDVVKRASQRVTDAFEKQHFIEFDENIPLKYFSKNPSVVGKNTPITTWIVADFSTESGRTFAIEMLESIEKNDKVALISNQKNPCDTGDFNLDEFDDIGELVDHLKHGSLFCLPRTVDIVEPGEMAIVSNGMIVGPLDSEFTSEDVRFLNKLWEGKRVTETSNLLNQLTDRDVSVKYYSVMAKIHEQGVKRFHFGELQSDDKKNVVVFPPSDPTSPVLTVTWIANPISREAQHIISLLKLIWKSTNARIEIIFNPNDAISEMPLKRFYRFVATDELQFQDDGYVEGHEALFSDMPQKQLLTMSIQTNDAWMIEVKQADHDLDNIMLETMGDVDSVFHLEHILVEGQASTPPGEPAHGVQIELESGEQVYDTIVMINLGYFQLKADPGVWSLRLRNGTSSTNHRIVRDDPTILVDSFTGKWEKIVIETREKVDEKKKSAIETIVDSAKNFFSSEEKAEDVINVFSLASGHLYERFLRIMMVSVMKNTRTKKVKFWLLKNYLSPKFKKSIPELAEHYGFDYELVEYKWPKWLHQQAEKQRVMWGYKILFLDVLFPLNLNKIIFVDADQVVRADLQELMDLDLNGAPYGYAPFCESRKEMEGFRFWKSGYWDQHLMGRRYHISALYVVDLKRFRDLFAGDRLRGRYEMLSSDPNSLSNLDQDLPNNMIHEVPIKTLPQDWLWCETWCDDGSKARAKTIDLCNNPLTKEPKMNSAKRIIGEWKELDEEIADVLERDHQHSSTSRGDRTEL